MKTKITFLAFVVFLLATSSCKKDKDEVTPFNSKYSNQSVEENKQSLEDNGIAMVDELDQLKSASGVEVAISFADKSQGEVVNKTASINNITPINLISSLADSKNCDDVVKVLKTTADDPQSLTAIWDSLVGKYTYNSSTATWTYSELADQIVFEFPGKEGDISNTASITVKNFTYQTIANPDYNLDGDLGNEFPANLDVELAYNGNIVSTFNFSASYTETAMPTSVAVTLTIDDFSLSAKTTHSPYTNASMKYSFKHGDKILAEMYADASGDWSQENIDNNTIDQKDFLYYDSQSGDSIYDYYTETRVQNILTKGNAYIQVMNIKLAGMVDAKGLASTLDDLDKQASDETITEEEYINKTAEACNKYMQLVVVYADTKEKIAAAQFNPYYETTTTQWGSYTDSGLDVVFVFADGSKVDADTYFSEGFDNLVAEINKFITNVNTEYDVKIDPVEY